MKTSKYIITDVKADKLFPGEQSGIGKKPESGHVTPTHVMWLDGDVIPGAFYSESVWIWPDCASEQPAAQAHTHTFTEVITFFGTDCNNPKDLCGEVELWLDGEKVPLEEGDAYVFRADVVPHLVTPVTEGERLVWTLAFLL